MARSSSFYCKIKQQQEAAKRFNILYHHHHQKEDEASTSDITTTTTCSKKAEDLVLINCPVQLFQKKGAKREKALETILEKFTKSFQYEFINRGNSITLLHRCLDCIKSDLKSGKCTRETVLASRIIGLLPLHVGCGDVAHEILEDSIEIFETSISKFFNALKPGSDSSNISCLVDTLAIITFVGGTGPEETERSMQIIWRFLGEELVGKPDTQVMISAISAWSFLLASIGTWSISPKLWKGSVSYLINLLKESDQSVLRIVAAETLAHIIEIESIEKFTTDVMDFNGGLLTCKVNGGSAHEQRMKKLKDEVKNVVVEISKSNSSGKKDLSKSQRSLSANVVAFLKRGCCPETSILIGRDTLPISNWSRFIQVDFLKRILGDTFVRHVKENELFHDFYDFTPKAEQCMSDLYTSSSDDEENAGIHYVFQPELSLKNPHYFRVCISENSVLNKAKTQHMKQQRFLSASKNAGYFSVSFGDDES